MKPNKLASEIVGNQLANALRHSQCCHNTALVGLSDSYEQFYQAIRRFWRFGQTNPVNVHVVISELEGAVLQNIKRKETGGLMTS